MKKRLNAEEEIVLKNKLNEEDRKKLRDLSQILLWLDSYHDIFSDFDPRYYSIRALSEDFLAEIKRASRDKPTGEIELRFLVPSDKRNKQDEIVIKKRLSEHFDRHFNIVKKEAKKTLIQGLSFIFFGVLLMVLTTFFLVHNVGENILFTFLAVLFEPGGWFLFWEGLDIVIFNYRRMKPNLEFYKKMAGSNISFYSY